MREKMKKIPLLAMLFALTLCMPMLASCDAVQGEQGIQGVQGEKGEQGIQGEQGIPGEKGDTGDTGATVEKVEFDEEGRLVITLTDGTVLDPIELPEKEEHEHHFGSVMNFGDNEGKSCEKRIYCKVCSECLYVELVGSNYKSHNYAKTYSYDKSHHWYACTKCDSVKDEEEHTLDEEGMCTVCNNQITPTEGILYELSQDGACAKVVGYTGKSKKIVIADEYQGVPVRSIGVEAFYNKFITSVYIPDGITGIDDYAFYNCQVLKDVRVPDSLEYIGASVFSACDSLEYCIEGNACYLGNNNNPYLILVKAKSWSIASCKINVNTRFIHNSAFFNCNNLSSITIPDGVESIGSSAFSYCERIESIFIPKSVSNIGECVFHECTNLKAISVDADNRNYQSVNDVLYTKDGSKLLRFPQKKDTASFDIPEGVTEICMSSFQGNNYLAGVTVPDSVQIIGNGAFERCRGLKSVVIGSGVKTVEDWAFSDCQSLESISVSEDNQEYKSVDGNLYSKDGTSIVNYAIGKKDTSFDIPDGVIYVENSAFEYCTNLKSVTIPESVTWMMNAFGSCSNLKSVIFENTNGWMYADSATDASKTEIPSKNLSDPSAAATYLTSSFAYGYWYRD